MAFLVESAAECGPDEQDVEAGFATALGGCRS